jgi:hypothetical protein
MVTAVVARRTPAEAWSAAAFGAAGASAAMAEAASARELVEWSSRWFQPSRCRPMMSCISARSAAASATARSRSTASGAGACPFTTTWWWASAPPAIASFLVSLSSSRLTASCRTPRALSRAQSRLRRRRELQRAGSTAPLRPCD